MYIVVQHEVKDQATAFARGEKLLRMEGAPEGSRGLQFYPSTDGSQITCLWEAETRESIQEYVDSVLGDAAVSRTYEVNASQAFAERPLGLPASAAVSA